MSEAVQVQAREHIPSTPPPAPGEVPATSPAREQPFGLTAREIEVLRLLSQGLSNPEIAAQLYLSEGTVRNYVSSILTKLDVSDRTQAALLALRAGLGG